MIGQVQGNEAGNVVGEVESPGGFVFGIVGWSWGEPRPKTITFFLDGTVKVCDQHGRPIKGTVMNGKEVLFAMTPPQSDDNPTARAKLATHAQVVAALAAEDPPIDWKKLTCAGWPQLPYADLSKLKDKLPPTPLEELRKIKDPNLRKDSLRARREIDAVMAKELEDVEEE